MAGVLLGRLRMRARLGSGAFISLASLAGQMLVSCEPYVVVSANNTIGADWVIVAGMHPDCAV